MTRRMQLLAAITALVVMGAGSGAGAQEEDDTDDRGLTEYEIACMPCHGVGGTGDGPDAARLSNPPADLTRLQSRNGGVFPVERVRDMIDGRASVASHGSREMPVWGLRYRVPIDNADDPAEVEKRARAVIDDLVEYLKSLQVP